MTAYGPWYISAQAVRDYLSLMGRPVVEDGPEWDRAERDLLRIAWDTVHSARKPAVMDSGALRYRGPAPERLILMVMPAPRAEGDLPQLVAVHPSHVRRS